MPLPRHPTISSGRGGAGCGRGGNGARPRLGVAKVREDLPDDGGIVQGGDQPQAAPAVRARQDVNGKRPVHQIRPASGARRALLPRAVRPCGLGRRRGRGLGPYASVGDHRSRERARGASRPDRRQRLSGHDHHAATAVYDGCTSISRSLSSAWQRSEPMCLVWQWPATRPTFLRAHRGRRCTAAPR